MDWVLQGAIVIGVVRFVVLPLYRNGVFDRIGNALRNADTSVPITGHDDGTYDSLSFEKFDRLPGPGTIRED